MIELPITNHKLKITPPQKHFVLPSPSIGPTAATAAQFTLDDLLASIPALPMQTAALGRTTDDSPLLFDLNDPHPGALLVVADRFSGKTQLLKTIAHSLMRRNRPYEVSFQVVSAHPEQWKRESALHADYFSTITANYQRAGADAILSACDLVESRQHGRNRGSALLFFLDGIDTLPYMDFDVRLNFEWLIQEGPAVQVWPVVSADSEIAVQNPRWVNLFRTRLAGFMHDKRTAKDLALINQLDFSAFERGRQFAVRIGRSWLQFYTPESPSE
jgi:hypothetical protein